MSSTNKTAELQLSQFVGTDIPSILTDYNGDMQKIDAGVREVKQATAGAIGDLSSVTARVTNAEQDINGLNTAVQGITSRVITAEGEIDNLQESVSNNQFKLLTTITTTGMTVSNALNALYQFLSALSSEKVINAKIKIDNTIYYAYQLFANNSVIQLRTHPNLRFTETYARIIDDRLTLSNGSSLQTVVTYEWTLPTGEPNAASVTHTDDIVTYNSIEVYA